MYISVYIMYVGICMYIYMRFSYLKYVPLTKSSVSQRIMQRCLKRQSLGMLNKNQIPWSPLPRMTGAMAHRVLSEDYSRGRHLVKDQVGETSCIREKLFLYEKPERSSLSRRDAFFKIKMFPKAEQ